MNGPRNTVTPKTHAEYVITFIQHFVIEKRNFCQAEIPKMESLCFLTDYSLLITAVEGHQQ